MARDDKTIGGRMVLARTEAGYRSAEAFVADVNQHLDVQGIPAISVSTYRKWEKIGTPFEDTRMTAYPHPVFYSVFCGLTGVTGHWLWYGAVNGIVKHISQLPPANRKVIDQQLASISCPRKLGLIEEFTRVVSKYTHRQQEALRAFLRLF